MKIKMKSAGKSVKVNKASKVNGKSPKSSLLKTPKVKKLKKKSPKKLEDISADDFMSGAFDDVDDNISVTSVSEEEIEVPQKRKKTKKPKPDSESSDEESEAPTKKKKKTKSHKEDLNKLKEVDPEFYKFLQENDKDLLDFRDISDDDDEGIESVHKPPEKLEVASDESDFEDDSVKKNLSESNTVTLKKIEAWREKLQTDRSTKTIREVFEAFTGALQCVVPENERVPCKYNVEGSAVFNSILRLCVIEVPPALRLILKSPTNGKQPPTLSKNWTKIRVILRAYLLDLIKLCQVTSPGMLTVLLKHVHQMAPYTVCFPNIASRFLTRLVNLWTSESDVVRVLSFLSLLRIANLKRVLLPHILKKMYLSFVRNSKFVLPSSLPGINFLRQSLAEMFALDPAVSYQHAFLYIRQLSIHLRNAVTLNKKESFQAVYNWQYIQSLHLWAELLCLVGKDSPLAGLVYPLVQITLGTIKLIPSAQYYPLRFHCVKFLLNLMDKRGVYIPVFPFLLEILRDFDFNKKHSKVSMKPMELSCVLRCSKLQMAENGFKDVVIETVCALLLEGFATEAYRISFPDTVVPAVIQMKQFLKVCKVSKYCKQVKAILDKVLENSKAVETERNKSSLRLDDANGIAVLEAGMRAKNLPLISYYESWKKLHQQQQAKKITDNEAIGDYKLPNLYKFDKKKSREREGPVELFPSDDEDDDDPKMLFGDNDDDDDDEEDVPKKKGNKKQKADKRPKKKNIEAKVESGSNIKIPTDWPEIEAKDIVEDLNMSDLD